MDLQINMNLMTLSAKAFAQLIELFSMWTNAHIFFETDEIDFVNVLTNNLSININEYWNMIAKLSTTKKTFIGFKDKDYDSNLLEELQKKEIIKLFNCSNDIPLNKFDEFLSIFDCKIYLTVLKSLKLLNKNHPTTRTFFKTIINDYINKQSTITAYFKGINSNCSPTNKNKQKLIECFFNTNSNIFMITDKFKSIIFKIFIFLNNVTDLSKIYTQKKMYTIQDFISNMIYTIIAINTKGINFPKYQLSNDCWSFFKSKQYFTLLIRINLLLFRVEQDVYHLELTRLNEYMHESLNIAKDYYQLKNLENISIEMSVKHNKCLINGQMFKTFKRFCYLIEKSANFVMENEFIKELAIIFDSSINIPFFFWQRSIINYDYHLKDKSQTINIILSLWSKANISTFHQAFLLKKLKKLKKFWPNNQIHQIEPIISTHSTLLYDMNPNITMRIIETNNRIFQSYSKKSKKMNKPYYKLIDKDNQECLTNVERIASEYYLKDSVFSNCIHGETSIILTIYGFLFWDIIYVPDIPGVFQSKFQLCPLDFFSNGFYPNRSKLIENRLEFIRNASLQEMKSLCNNVWVSDNFNSLNPLIDWQLFSDFDEFISLLSCFNFKNLCNIFELLLNDFRFWRSGFPDLTLWNKNTLKLKFVEVKSSNDQLSDKQVTWLNHLYLYGFDCEVCKIEVVGSSYKKNKMKHTELNMNNEVTSTEQ